jgi:copper chaperone CopZ
LSANRISSQLFNAPCGIIRLSGKWKTRFGDDKEDTHMDTHVTIHGMHCDGCKRLVEKRIGSLPGVREVKTNPGSGETRITGSRIVTPDEIRAVLTGTEYSVS